MTYGVMYRGPLTSCNYSCAYCPFAKRLETASQLQRDRTSLRRFVDWIPIQHDERFNVLFTPWGEALVRSWYRDAFVELSHQSNVASVAVQTNLSCNIDWIRDCNLDRVGLWATLHATEVSPAAFISKVERLRELGVSMSVGMVAVPSFLDQIEDVRKCLPPDVYLWLNAQQPRSRPYRGDEVARLVAIDPHFRLTLRRERSIGRPCRAGETTFAVDGDGDMRRCHFVDEVIGNIYSSNWQSTLRPRGCPKQFCDCFLGKAQLRADELTPFFGDRLLERIPIS
jgi:MoaA/NifB/PqqE/SkfB family radical SAM enzyme